MSRSNVVLLTRSVLLMLVLFGIVFLAAGVSAAAQGSAMAPVNPEFIKYSQNKAAGLDMGSAMVTPDGHALGLIPSPRIPPEIMDTPISVSGTGDSAYTSAGISTTTYPVKYDLRIHNEVSPVRDQGQFGTCWAHAALASLESTLMPLTPPPNYSEKNMANKAGYALSIPNGGGNMYMATAYLTRWNGPVNEATDPYPTGATWTTSATYSPVKHVQNVIFFPSHTTSGVASTSNIKAALVSNGAVDSAFYWKDAYYNNAHAAYYQPYTTAANVADAHSGGHAVTIVGWDDNFAKTNFSTAAPGNGAWLVKNSWGTGWGKAGYFYISYYDKYFGSRYHNEPTGAGNTKDTAQFFGEPTTHYNKLYSNDKFGEVNDAYVGTQKTGSFANEFTSTAAGNITAVGFYTTDMNVPVTIKVYRSPTTTSPVTGTLISTYTTTVANMGYNTVKIPVAKQGKLTNGQKFSVVITVTNPTNAYYIPFEYNCAGYTSGIISTTGQGFVKDGSTWKDWSTFVTNNWGLHGSHLAIKAYSK